MEYKTVSANGISNDTIVSLVLSKYDDKSIIHVCIFKDGYYLPYKQFHKEIFVNKKIDNTKAIISYELSKVFSELNINEFKINYNF